MKHLKSTILLLATTAATSGALSRSDLVNAQSSTSPANTCTLKTGPDWSRFLRSAANEKRWIVTCEDGNCDEAFMLHVRSQIKNVLDKCPDATIPDQKIRSCISRLRRFVPAWMHQHDNNSYGFYLDSKEYLKYQESVGKPPGMMTPPQEIVNALPNLPDVVKASVDHGWKYLLHDSAINNSRLFIYFIDPSGRFDRWLILNLDEYQEIDLAQPLSIMAVEKKSADGQILEKSKLYFRDYLINKNKEKFELAVKDHDNGKCYSCHPSGARQLINHHTQILSAAPVRGEADFGNPPSEAFGWKRLQEFNKALKGYGLPDWDGLIVPDDFGPALGNDQECTDCHDGEDRGVINIATSHSQLTEKIVTELAMNPDRRIYRLLEASGLGSQKMSPSQRRQLSQAFAEHQKDLKDLSGSAFTALRDWLLTDACE
jgi:hypothetical protein